MKQEMSLKHQLRWDLKYVRWALLVLAALAPLQVGLELREFESGNSGVDLGLLLSQWVWILMMIVSVVALVLVIQKDTPTGAKEFWVSRPMSRRGMYASKLVVLGLFMIFLGGVSLCAPLLSGGGDYWREFLAGFLVRSAWVLVLACGLAAVSPGLKEVLLNALLLGGVVLLVSFVKVSFLEEGMIYYRPHEEKGNALVVAWGVFLVGGVGLVGWYYLGRTAKGGLIGLLALLAVSGGIYQLGSFDLFSQEMTKAEKEEKGWGQVRLQLNLSEEDRKRYYRGSLGSGSSNGIRTDQVMCSGVLESLPKGFSIRGIDMVGGFEVGGQANWLSPGAGSVVPTYLGREPLLGLANLTDNGELGLYGSYESPQDLALSALNLGTFPVTELEKWQGKAVTYRGLAKVEAVKTMCLARFKFGKNEVQDSKGVKMKITFEEGEQGKNLFKIEGKSWYPKPFFRGLDFQGGRFFLVNEKKKTFLECRSSRAGSAGVGRTVIWEKKFDLRRSSNLSILKKLPNRKEWLAESSLYVFAPIPQGTFTVPVELIDFDTDRIPFENP